MGHGGNKGLSGIYCKVITMRSTYIVAYDIKDDKRLRKVFTTMRGFGNPLQYSVFKCNLSEREKTIMKVNLFKCINNNQDSVIIINLGTSDFASEKKIEQLGAVRTFDDNLVSVI
jgi:CRISPR-associated protein Cas2